MTGSTNQRRRHHQVPVFYLASFVDPTSAKPVVWVYDKDGAAPRPQSPRDTAVKKNFYAFTLPDGSRAEELERLLGTLENNAAPILKRWAATDEGLSPAEKIELAQFLGFMHARVPRQVEVVKELLGELPRSMARRAVEDESHLRRFYEDQRAAGVDVGLPIDEFRELLRDLHKHVKIEPNEKVALAYSLSVTAEVRDQLLTMNWCLCTSPEGSSFVTSDAPLTILSRRGPLARFGGGLALPTTEVTFPISPRVCLLLDRRRIQSRRRVSRTVVSDINRRTAFNAERFVIAHLRSKAIERLVQEAARTRSLPKLDPQVLRHQIDRFARPTGPPG